MSTSLGARRVFAQRPHDFRLQGKPVLEQAEAFWRINGYRVRLLIWTRDEWEKLETPPSDAQFHPVGVWCSLRVD
jgi:hypothetical protein